MSTSSVQDRSSSGGAGSALRLVKYYPVFWACGLGALVWPAIAVATAGQWKSARLRAPSGAVLALLLCLVLSTGVGILAGYGSFDRVLGFVGNLSIWAGLFGLLSATSSSSYHFQRRFLIAAIAAGIVNGCVAAASVAMYPEPFPVPLTGGLSEDLPPAMKAFMSNQLAYEDWLGETVLRANGTMGFPTWSGAVSALTILLVLFAVRRRMIRLATAVLALAVSAFAVHYAFSRATEAALLAAMAYVAMRFVWRKYRVGPLIVMTLVSFGSVLLYLNISKAVDLVAEMNAAREGSAESRGAIYSATFTRISDLTIPVLGYGIKPRQGDLLASVASHSAYLGLLFKAGVLGLLAFLLLLVFCWRESQRASSSLPSATVLFIGLWCVLEDFDTGHFVPVMLVAAVCAAHVDRNGAVVSDVVDEPAGRGRTSTAGVGER